MKIRGDLRYNECDVHWWADYDEIWNLVDELRVYHMSVDITPLMDPDLGEAIGHQAHEKYMAMVATEEDVTAEERELRLRAEDHKAEYYGKHVD